MTQSNDSITPQMTTPVARSQPGTGRDNCAGKSHSCDVEKVSSDYKVCKLHNINAIMCYVGPGRCFCGIDREQVGSGIITSSAFRNKQIKTTSDSQYSPLMTCGDAPPDAGCNSDAPWCRVYMVPTIARSLQLQERENP